MSISTAIQNLKQKISNAYDKIEEANGTLPVVRNADNLALAIESIPEGYELEDGITLEPKIWHVIFMSENNEVARYTIDEFKDVTSLPAIPDVEDCIADGWNWTIDKIKTYINTQTITSDIVVGAQYKSADGTTILYCSIPKGGRQKMSLYLKPSVASGLQIDWGDGNTENSTSTTAKAYVHEYSLFGDYKIKLTCKSGTLQLGGASSSYNIFGTKSNSATNPNSAYARCINKVIIGNGMTSIGTYAFQSCYSLQNISIPSTVTSIGTYAFQYCYSLQNISIPNSVKSIGNQAFQNCYSLQNVYIPSTMTSIGTYTFQNCYSLQNMSIPSSVTSIGTYVFSGCWSLQNISIPSTVTSIGTYAFSACYSLQNISIPSSVTSIGSSAFNDCYSLQCKLLNNIQSNNLICFTLQLNNCSKYLNYKTNINKIIAVDLKTIINNAFQSCYSLQTISIPNSVKSIGTYAFQYCYSLQNISIPNSVTSIGTYAFQNCCSLQNMSIPSSVTSIGNYVFSGCRSLQNISIPSSVTSIGNSAFSYCCSLQNMSIPSSVTSIIDNNAFQNCYSLQNISIPNSVKSIGTQTFQNCYSLQNVSIPSFVTSIGTYAFQNCYSLQYVKWDSSANIPSSCFSGCYGVRYYDFSDATKVIALGSTSYIQVNNDTEIIVPDSLYDSWKAAANWSNSAIVTHIVKKSSVPFYANYIGSSIISNILTTYIYNGSEIKPIPEVTIGDKTLTLDVDYEIEYSPDSPRDAGVYTLTIRGIGNYFGSTSVTYQIISDKTLITDCDIVGIQNVDCTKLALGATVTLNISIYYGELHLVEGSDYVVSYSNNIKQIDDSTATVTITGINSYAGTVTRDFLLYTIDCVLKGSKISLADGTTKNVEDITYDDVLLVWDFDNGCFSSAKPLWIKKPSKSSYWFENELEDGKTLYTTGHSNTGWGHRMFDIDKGKFVYTTESVSDMIKTIDGESRHIKCIRHNEECEYYNIITDRHINMFVNGILTSCSYNNIYPIANMKYVKDDRTLRDKNEFSVDDKWYNGLRLAEQEFEVSAIRKYITNLENKEI